MKSYFKFILAVLAALAATAALVGCTKEITPPSFGNDKVNPEGSRVIAVSFAPQTKTTLNGLQPKFVDKDSILISNGEALDTCEVNVSGGKATISTDLTGPLKAVYPYTAAAVDSNDITGILVPTEQDGTFASANICKAEMENENEVSLTFGNKTAVFRIATGAGAETKYVEVSAKGFAIANQFPEGSKYTSLDTIHVEVPEANKPSQYFVSILVPDGLKVGDLSFSDGTNVKLISDENLATPVAVNSIYTVTALNWEVIGALKGMFSVSADRKVRFSQGNLRYVVKTNKWSFYEHQYDFCHTKTYTGHHSDTISLFTWGYNAEQSILPDGQKNDNVSRTSGDLEQTEDWGSRIGDGNTWRTLTAAEWMFLLSNRNNTSTIANTSNARYVTATVNGIAGMILFPDSYEHPSQVATPLKINQQSPLAFSDNIYDLTAWEAMESAGAVFLPAAGSRNASSITNSNDKDCFYWSSSAKDDSFAYRGMSFGINNYVYIGTEAYTTRYAGYSVRLVTDVKVDPVAAYTSAYLDTISSVPAWEFDLTTWDGDDSKCADIYVKAEMAGKICGNYTIENSGTFAGKSFTSTFGGKPVASGTISITLLEPETINSRAYYEIQIAGVTQDGNAFSCKYGSTITAYDAKGYSVSVIDDGYVPEPVCFEIPERESIMEAVLVQNQIGVTIRVTGSNNPAMTTASCETKTVTIGGKQYSFGRKLNTGGKFNLDSKDWRKLTVYAPARGTMYVITDDELGFVEIGSAALTKGDGYVSFFADFENGRNEYTLTFASAIDIYGFVFVPDTAN